MSSRVELASADVESRSQLQTTGFIAPPLFGKRILKIIDKHLIRFERDPAMRALRLAMYSMLQSDLYIIIEGACSVSSKDTSF